LGSSSALISALVSNIFIILQGEPNTCAIKELSIEEQANILLSGLVANNFAQNKVN
jgi:hypothetical protein